MYINMQAYLTFNARKVDIESLTGIQSNAGSGRGRNRREGIDRCGKEEKGRSLEFHCVLSVDAICNVKSKVFCFSNGL